MKSKRKNYAIIDFGAHSIRLLVFRLDKKGKLFQVNRSIRVTRLGQNVSKTGMIIQDAMNRNLEAALEFIRIAQDYEVEKIYAFGTSALRDAANADTFVDLIKERTGVEIEVISGAKEALYAFMGVSQCFLGDVLVFDIGGGSTELILGRRKIEKMVSLSMGAVRSTEEYMPVSPITPEEIDAFYAHACTVLSEALKDFDLKEDDSYRLVGTGGTVSTLAMILQSLEIYDSSLVHGFEVTCKKLDEMIRELAAMNVEERSRVAGLEAKRADIIVAGSIIARAILEVTGRQSFTVCDYDNMQGAAFLKFLSEEEQIKQVDQQTSILENQVER